MPEDSEPIVCHTTKWYSRRRLLMIAMLLFFSLFFLYDWRYGYPKQRDEYNEYWPQYRQMVEQGQEENWFALAKEKKWPAKPVEKNWDRKIAEQLFFGVLTGVGGLWMLAVFMRNRQRTLSADADSFTTPDGRRVPFATAFRIDKRKWDNKGLAYVSWRDDGKERKAVIDDLIFGGAGRVLDRLLAHFQGELIELEKPARPDEQGTDPDNSGESTGTDEVPVDRGHDGDAPAEPRRPAGS